VAAGRGPKRRVASGEGRRLAPGRPSEALTLKTDRRPWAAPTPCISPIDRGYNCDVLGCRR
jgi:hypothetical protein